MDKEKASLLPLVTYHGCPTRFAADHHHSYQCSDIYLALLPVKRWLICGSHLIHLRLCGCTFSEMGSFYVRVVFWPSMAVLSGGQRLGNSQGGLCPNTSTASESFMQPFSCTLFQDLLAGYCLTMHSYSCGTTLNGDMRLLCRATIPGRTTTNPHSQAPKGLETADLVGDSHLLFHSASGPCAGGRCVISGGFSWTKVWLASPNMGCSPR